MGKDLTVKEVLDTMTPAQKNTLYFHVGMALNEKIKYNPPYADIESFNEDQKKVFYYLIGCALEKDLDSETLEIIKGDN